MNKLIMPVFAIALCFASCHGHPIQAAAWAQESEPAKVDGTWQMSMDSPHGVVKGAFHVEQKGAKLTGTFDSDLIGPLAVTGVVDGKKVSFSLTVPGQADAFTFSGTVEGAKMSGTTVMNGAWSATRQ